MPRAYQAYPQNAVVTHSPATVNGGDPSQAIQAAKGVFTVPSTLDVCFGITNGGTQNPFLSGLNTMGEQAGNTSGATGQTGNMLSGLQGFLDTLCGFATGGGGSTMEVLQAARQLRAEGTDLHETLESLRKLRATVGAGTTPQSVIAGVSQVNDAANNSPMASGILSMGQQNGSSGNVAIDGINGGQSFLNILFAILAICGCGRSNVSGPLEMPMRGVLGTDLNPYAPENVTPDIIISAAQQIADTVSANPLAMNILASGMPTASGNLGVAAVNGAAAAATSAQNDISAASTLGQANAEAISLQAINNANYHAVDRTLNAVFNITSITGNSPDTITVTQDASSIGFVTIPTTTTKTYGVFIGYLTGTLTSAYINVYKVDATTQVLTLVSSSLNLVSSLSSNLEWIYATLQTDIPVSQAQCYAVELAVQGSGTLTIVGLPNHWLMANTSGGVYPAQLAAMRSTDVFDSSVVWSGTGSVTTGSWTHIIGALATAVFVTVNAVGGGGTPSATCGGTAMTLLENYSYSGGHIYVWVLYTPPTGSQTISFTGLTSSLVSAASVAFNGVTAAGTPVTTSGTGTALSQSATGAAGGLLFQAFGYSAGTGAITGYNQTQAAYQVGSSSNCDPLIVGYTTATGSAQSFTATGSVSDPWGAVAIPLTATIPTVTAPASITAPAYSPNVPWLALSSVIPTPQRLSPAPAAMTLTPGAPVVTYPGSPTLFVLVDSSSATTHTISSAYGAFEYTGSASATWTLPPISGNNGVLLFFYNRGAAPVSLACAGADTFYRPSGATAVSLNPSSSMTLTNDGVYWLPV